MRSRDFNKELELYIARRRSQAQVSKSFVDKLGIRRVSFSLPRKAKHVRNLKLLEANTKKNSGESATTQSIEEVVVEKSVVKKPFITKIIEFFKGGQPVEEDVEIELEPDAIEEDLKELTKQVLKRLHEWLKKLPPEAKQEFKNSQDFELYKKLLREYGLVK